MDGNTSTASLDAPRDAAAPPLGFAGQAGELAPIVLRNTLLNLVTLTLYRFWGKTEVRRYLWRNVRLFDEAMEYTGTGRELFLGFVVVLFLVLLPLALVTQGVPQILLPGNPVAALIGSLTYPLVLFLIGVAIYRARRYRLTRTLWRGIRGRLTGKPNNYGMLYMALTLLNVFTAWLAYPWTRVVLFGRLTQDMAFGDRQFAFAGRAGPLYGPFVLALVSGFFLLIFATVAAGVLGVGVLGGLAESAAASGQMVVSASGVFAIALTVLLYGAAAFVLVLPAAYYRAREFAHFARATALDAAGFRFGAGTRDFARLYAGNLLIWIVTLGLGHPFVQLRNLRFLCRHLAIDGDLDIEAIRRAVAENPAYGEGLADAFDVDFL